MTIIHNIHILIIKLASMHENKIIVIIMRVLQQQVLGKIAYDTMQINVSADRLD